MDQEGRVWRDEVQSRLVSLTNSEITQNDRLDELEEEINAIREMLEGKSNDREDNGIKGDIHDLSVMVNSLRAIMAPDSLGSGGIINRLKNLERKDERENRTIEVGGKVKSAIIAAISALTVATLYNIKNIEAFIKAKDADPIDQAIEKAKRPKGHPIYRKHIIQEVPTEEQDE